MSHFWTRGSSMAHMFIHNRGSPLVHLGMLSFFTPWHLSRYLWAPKHRNLGIRVSSLLQILSWGSLTSSQTISWDLCCRAAQTWKSREWSLESHHNSLHKPICCWLSALSRISHITMGCFSIFLQCADGNHSSTWGFLWGINSTVCVEQAAQYVAHNSCSVSTFLRSKFSKMLLI